MGNYHAETSKEMLEQLQKWMRGIIQNVVVIDNQIIGGPETVCCYIIECEEKYYYREIDFAEKRLFSGIIKIPLTNSEKVGLETIPPTEYMARALKCMGVI